MKRKNITFAILLLAVICTAFGVSGTYARYITTDSGKGTATVAKWSAVVTGWTGTGTSQTLTLEAVENPYVVSGLIAPDADAMGILTVDLEGTQVATDIMASLGTVTVNGVTVTNPTDHFTTKLRIYAANTTDAEIKADASKSDTESCALATLTSSTEKYTIELNTGKTALVNEEVKVAVSMHWIHSDTTTGWNDWDTTVGEYGTSTAPTIEATLELTAQQHVVSDT